MGLTVPLKVTVVVPVEPAEPVVTDGAATAPVAAPVAAPVVVVPPEPVDVVAEDPLDAPVDEAAGHPSAWSEVREDWAVCRLA